MENEDRLDWETFVVRLWRERATGTWRGQITHLPGRESSYFATLAQAETFMTQFMPGLESQPGEERKGK